MEYKSSPDPLSLKNLRIARLQTQDEVAEAIGTNANTVSRWERGIATPSLYYRRKLAEYFGVDTQELFSDLNGEIDKTTALLPLGSGPLENGSSDEEKNGAEAPKPSKPEALDENGRSQESHFLLLEPETVVDSSNETKDVSQGDGKIPPTWLRGLSRPSRVPHRVYIPVVSIVIFMLVLGGVFVLSSLLHKPLPSLFSALCRGNFQSANTPPNTSIVATPAASTSPDGDSGLSEGQHIFDRQRPGVQSPQEIQYEQGILHYKDEAAQAIMNDPQDVVPSLTNAINIDQTDAEAQIYLENWKVLASNHPHVTLVVGTEFVHYLAGAKVSPVSRSILQGAFTAQKECNEQNRKDESKTLIVVMIANISGKRPDDRANNAKFVANQIVDQAIRDPTIVGVLGWPSSGNSVNVNQQLKARKSTSALPMVSPSASTDELGEMSNFFRVCPTNSEQAQIVANFVLGTKQKKRIAILYQSGDSFAESLQNDFAKGMPNSIIASESYIESKPDTFRTALKEVLAQNPDAIFLAGNVSDLVVLLNEISSTPQANNLLIVGGDAFANTGDYESLPSGLARVYFTAFASPNEWDGIDPKPLFFQDYRTNFGTHPSPTGLSSINVDAMLSYDAMLALLHGTEQVLSKQDTITPSDLKQALKQITPENAIQGITGRIAFKENGDQQNKRVIWEHIEGTKLKVDGSQGCFRLTDNCSS